MNTIDEMIGVVMACVKGKKGDNEMIFEAADGRRWCFYHEQDCCESVAIEDVVGDLADLVGLPLTMAEIVSSDDNPRPHKWSESWTWTFYKFATAKGYVTVRWLGESNGYYSESVDFARVA